MLSEKTKNIVMLQTAMKRGGTHKCGLNFKTHALQHVEIMV